MLKDRERGVTLIELLVVLVIISVALSIVVPSMANSYESWALRSTGKKIAALFRFGSESARQSGVDLACYYEDHRFVLLRNDSIFKELQIPASLNVQPEKPQGIIFLSTGQIIASREFVLQSDRGRKVIIQSGPMPGQITVEEPSR